VICRSDWQREPNLARSDSKARVTVEKRLNALAQAVSPRLSPRQSFEKCVITPFAIFAAFAVFAAFALVRPKTAFINVDLGFSASSKNNSIQNFSNCPFIRHWFTKSLVPFVMDSGENESDRTLKTKRHR
jgi:hypothetical protein